jgi:glycosyltransferase involved in cell wall biosynthesis
MTTTPLRVCIDARLVPGVSGGVEQALIGLLHGFAKLDSSAEEYWVHVYGDCVDWIKPHLGNNFRILAGEAAPSNLAPQPPAVAAARRIFHHFPKIVHRLTAQLPQSTGILETRKIDVVHFPHQNAFLTKIPSIFQPWDLQHLHLPRFFTPRAFTIREMTYRAYCGQAALIGVNSESTRRDLIHFYQVPPDKIFLAEGASAIHAYPLVNASTLDSVSKKYRLPKQFLFYPAQTWAHKNHLGLLKALSLLRTRHHIDIPLVCSGKKTPFFKTIGRTLRHLDLDSQVRFIGFIPPEDLHSLYRLCEAVVYPSFFEGYGLPLLEAFHARAPVACSNASCLPETTRGAALLFDPYDPDKIASAILSLWNQPDLKKQLVERGHTVVSSLSWEKTALIYRAVYKKIGGRALEESEKKLLQGAWAPLTS